MDIFLNMTINEFLELQKEINKIKTYNDLKDLKSDRNIFYLFKENISFFNDIANDIEEKMNEFYDSCEEEDED